MSTEINTLTDHINDLMMNEIINLKAEIAFLKKYISKIPELIAEIKTAQQTGDAALSLIESLSEGKKIEGHVQNGMFVTEEDLQRGEDLQKMFSSQNGESKGNILEMTPRNKYYSDLSNTIADEILRGDKPTI